MPKDATGNITISIDGDEKYCQPVSFAMNVVIINELNLDWGMHNASVKYTGDDKYKGFVENGQFEHNYFHFKVSGKESLCERLDRKTQKTIQCTKKPSTQRRITVSS